MSETIMISFNSKVWRGSRSYHPKLFALYVAAQLGHSRFFFRFKCPVNLAQVSNVTNEKPDNQVGGTQVKAGRLNICACSMFALNLVCLFFDRKCRHCAVW